MRWHTRAVVFALCLTGTCAWLLAALAGRADAGNPLTEVALNGQLYSGTAGGKITFRPPAFSVNGEVLSGDTHIPGVGLDVLQAGHSVVDLLFRAPQGEDLATASYRDDDQSLMSIAWNAVGCNGPGHFAIYQLSVTPGGALRSLAMSFVFQCEPTGPSLSGVAYINGSALYSLGGEGWGHLGERGAHYGGTCGDGAVLP